METIGRYQVGARIGVGSFATVFKGRDPILDVPVAIKVLAENWSANPDVRNRFLAEARLLRRFHDERIVPVHDIGTTAGDQPYFVMDYADAGSLEQLRRQPTAPGRALRLTAEAARGVEVLHRHNVIHRDITPGNILLQYSKQGVRVMLADLGVAKSLTEPQEGTMTAGTPAYMAYEQATGGWLDQRVDVYSLAAVAYSLLTGHPPFPIKTLNDLLVRDWSVGVTPIADTLGAPPVLDEVMAMALSPDPQQRPQSALELATVFDAIADVLPGGDTYAPRPEGMDVTATGASWAPFGGTRPLAPPPLSGGSPEALSWRSAPPPIAPPGTGWGSMVPPSPSSAGSYYSLGRTSSVVPRDETPQQMLDKYLGEGKYTVAEPKERRPVSFYVAVGIGLTAVFLLALVLTIRYLT
ncbi:serine/threonine-protein kinase [Brooklawnia cerclae]|uniref:non-specific serine/threonine protein kinase n=1 Tax=Brooklawnia cerclae TaxID=349934 RepID=A0ABX0SC94_9ACTN|nr:serine/threonine-protein kinase [Brooklawnia cerclae]NIH56007.1 hypothetical protein [Brooklawnia cerclae]